MVARLALGIGSLVMGPAAVSPAGDAPESPFHQWMDASGKYAVEAQFVKMAYDREAKTGVVTLRKRDGTTVDVDLDRLSAKSKALAVRLQAAGRRDERQTAEEALPVFDVHFCVITKNPKAHRVATLDQLKREVDILNTYFVPENRKPVIRFRFKQAHFYEEVAGLDCRFVELGDGKVPYDTDGWAKRFNQCPHPQVRDPQAINFFIYDSYGKTNGAADTTSHGKRNSNRPYVLIDWERLDHRIQSPEEHEVGHAFGLGHVFVDGATGRSSTNIMASRHAGGSGGRRDVGFNPEQVKTILHHASITYQRLYRKPMPAAPETPEDRSAR